MSKVGRNDPCPCGSGKKYKRCCLAKGGIGGSYTGRDRQQALEALDRFVDGPGWGEVAEDAEQDFWGELDPDETAIANYEALALMSEQVFDWWLFFDYEYDLERRVVDAFLETTGNLSTGERSFLTMARTTRMWVYQVTEVRPGVGMTLRDVVTGAEARVVERAGSQQIHRWDVIATRIMPVGGSAEPVLDGGVLPIGPMRAEPLAESLRQLTSDGKTEHDALEDWVPDIHAAWLAPLKMPEFVNFDGDPVLLARVYFDVIDTARLIVALDGAKPLQRVEGEGGPPRWNWTGKGKSNKQPVVYGWFSLSDQRLEFETNSKERAERGRKLVERLAGDAVQYKLMRTEDPEQAAKAMKERDPDALERSDLERHPELREAGHAAVEQHMTEHYERWLDEPVPRFDDHTPRVAATSPKLRRRVVEMLEELEGIYEKALSGGDPAFDPTWMWEALGLDDESDAPAFRKATPMLGHESLVRNHPDLPALAEQIARRLRRRSAPNDLTAIATPEQLTSDLGFQRFARQCHSSEFALHAAMTLVNFELHLRKVFWVGEPLSWMLGATKLDVTGSTVRLPFQSVALVFTDRYALGLAERMDSRLPKELRVGRMLQVLTVYVTTTAEGAAENDRQTLNLSFIGDVLDGTPPSLIPCRLELDDQRLEATLNRVVPGVAQLEEDDAVRPLYQSQPLRDLLALVMNALLYATSADAEVQEKAPSKPKSKTKRTNSEPLCSSETVFYLPGTIDITTLKHVKKARRGGKEYELSRRCMVLGHWRRAQKSWTDPRPRWIKPHWRGPSAAAIVERQYRLEK